MRTTLTIVILFACHMAFAKSAYRPFTNAAGKTIEARIVKFDAKNQKVLLELRSLKNAWVTLDNLSIEDQQFINDWNGTQTLKPQKEPESKLVKEASSAEVLAVAEKYQEAILERDYELWHSLFEKFHKNDPRLNERKFKAICDAYVSVTIGEVHKSVIRREIVGFTVHARLEAHDDSRTYRHANVCLYFTRDGQLKYSMTFQHPVSTIAFAIEQLYDDSNQLASNYKEDIRVALSYLNASEIPGGDLQWNDPKNVRRKKIKKIARWIQRNGDEWDMYKPEVFLKEDTFKIFKLCYPKTF